jgi:hypothetical protein
VREDIPEGPNVWVLAGETVRGINGYQAESTWWVAITGPAGEVYHLNERLRPRFERLLPAGAATAAQPVSHDVASVLKSLARRSTLINGRLPQPDEM